MINVTIYIYTYLYWVRGLKLDISSLHSDLIARWNSRLFHVTWEVQDPPGEIVWDSLQGGGCHKQNIESETV